MKKFKINPIIKKINKFKRFYCSQIAIQELSIAEKCKSLINARKSGTLSTVSSDNQLFGGLMPYVLSEEKHPIVALRKTETHSKHLEYTNNAAIVIWTLTPAKINPSLLNLPKINFWGETKQYTDKLDIDIAKEKYRNVHRGSIPYLGEFDFFEIIPKEIIYDYGGNIKTITKDEYQNAMADPISKDLRRLLDAVNKGHRNSLFEVCRDYGNLEVSDVFMWNADRYGFNLLGKNALYDEREEWTDIRVPFSHPQDTVESCAQVLKDTFSSKKNK